MDLTQRIISIREAKRIKQAEIARVLNLDNANYSRLEKRGNKLSLEQVQSIADALGVTLSELLGIETPTNQTERVQELEKRVQELEIDVKNYAYFLKKAKYNEYLFARLSLMELAKSNKLNGLDVYETAHNDNTDFVVMQFGLSDEEIEILLFEIVEYIGICTVNKNFSMNFILNAMENGFLDPRFERLMQKYKYTKVREIQTKYDEMLIKNTREQTDFQG